MNLALNTYYAYPDVDNPVITYLENGNSMASFIVLADPLTLLAYIVTTYGYEPETLVHVNFTSTIITRYLL